jgi:aspartyl-tRNA(Asn)/glutamyl-tRNA(Gln) amidotransferase subunit C
MNGMSASIDIHRIATLSRLQLSAEEADLYEGQLQNILSHMDVLSRYDLASVEPSAHAMPVFDVWRADVALPGLSAEEALLNAPRRSGDQFQITKVVE